MAQALPQDLDALHLEPSAGIRVSTMHRTCFGVTNCINLGFETFHDFPFISLLALQIHSLKWK